jgi:hypothetical protein
MKKGPHSQGLLHVSVSRSLGQVTLGGIVVAVFVRHA